MMDPMVPRPYRMERMRLETHDTFTMELRPAGESNGTFAPGQFNMLYVFGVGEVPISISGDPGKQGSLVHTTRAVGTVTEAMRELAPGSTVGVRGPFGHGWPIDEGEGSDVVIVAGGIGLAPLRPVLYRVLARREKYGKVVLLYGTRTPQDLLFRTELEKWRSRFDLDVIVTVDNATPTWKGNVGFVTWLVRRATFDPLNTIAMICGPEIMMRYTTMELLQRGVSTDNIFLSMERNMKCATGFCGHCQFGPTFVCKDGPVFAFNKLEPWLAKGEI